MGLANIFGFGSSGSTEELPEIFPMTLAQADFLKIDVQCIYKRILTDVLERTDGIPDDKQKLLWDNCVASESPDGLVTLLVKAMTDKADLFLIYDSGTDLIRVANSAEQAKIKTETAKENQSKTGVYISFKKYDRTDMIKLYSILEYCTVSSLYKSMNLSKAVQIKLTDLRSSVGLNDAADAKAQVKSMADSLSKGKDIYMDAKDVVETSKPDLTATESAMEFIAEKRSFYLGYPASYITGEYQKALGDSGSAEKDAIEQAHKGYYFSIIKPVVEVLLQTKTTFKSENYDQIVTATTVLKDFELTTDELIGHDNKLLVINRLFGLPADAKGDPPKEPDLTTLPPGVVPPVDPNKPPGKAPPFVQRPGA